MRLEILFVSLTILLFGSWAVPTKTLKTRPEVQAFWLTVGHFLLSAFIFIFVARPISFADAILPFFAGLLWGAGIISGYIGIKHLGITRAISIWIPLVILTSAFWGLIFFGEARALSTEKLFLTCIGIAFLISAALAVVFSAKDEKKLGNVQIGVLASIILGIAHGSYFVPLRVSVLPVFVTFFPLTVGMVVATACTVIVKRLQVITEMKSIFRMILAGFILGGGNYTALLTIQYLGVSQGYPLTQLGIVVNTLWGVFLFKEITNKRGKTYVIMGVLLAIVGAIILNAAK